MRGTELTPARARATEFVATAVLSLAGVATSWSGYQASLWSGIQAMHYNRASANRVEATREFTAAGQVASIDIALFMSWADAYATGNDALEKFHRERFRKGFKPAFEEWLAAGPMKNPRAEPTPFTLPSYRVAHRDDAQALESAAEREFRDGQVANQNSDNYVLTTVMLAIVLFFAGISQQFRIHAVRLALLGIATVLLAAGSIALVGMPRA